MNFKDKVVIVTGGTRGIGLEVAKSFYEKEANVIIFGSKKESVDKALEELSKDNILVEGYYPNLNNYQEVVETIDKIYNKALNMKAILEEFDDYQSCNIKDTLKLNKIFIKDILEYVKNDFEDELNDKNINLEISSTCSQREITVDLVKLKRVFGNIINNSVTHFNGRDGLIKINVLSRANMIRFEIADNGGGVKTETDLKRIFEPLYTTDPSRKISGLGLSICKQIISSFDGRIYAKNNEIGGLSIIFLIPKS